MTMRYAWIAFAVCVAASAHAQLKIVDFSPNTITFDHTIGWNDGIPDNDVIRGPLPAGPLRLYQRDAWGWSQWNGSWVGGVAQSAFSYQRDTENTPFDDYEGYGQATAFEVQGFDLSTAGLGTGMGLTFTPDTWYDKSLTLRVLNATGGTVSAWNIGLDAWFNDLALLGGTLYLQVSANHVDYTTIDSLISTNTGAGWSGRTPLGGLVNVAVPDGGYLYVRLFYDVTARGNQFVIDNLSVQAVDPVPEPSTMALVGMGLAATLRHRRKTR